MHRSSKFLARHIHASRKSSSPKLPGINNRFPRADAETLRCSRVGSPARAKLDAMDQVLKDHNICVEYATMLALNPDAPKSINTQEIELNFRSRAEDVTVTLRSDRANRVDIF
ncbi:hypothetical protein CIB48_g4103 [Xylaria polymorpha]|nr:hypothetical protein CIB48_g4103 [Xylaria polymorpha]